MTDEEKIGLVILASGMSRRFGQKDKLLAPFRGEALAVQSANLGVELQCSARICILKSNSPELQKVFSSRNIDIIINERPDDGQGHSLSLGMKEIADRGCHSAYLVLADMPLVKPSHLRMLHTQIGDHEVAIAYDGKRRSPPALFRQSMFRKLIDQAGDTGAKEVLRASRVVKYVTMPPLVLTDVDTPEDLKRIDTYGKT